MYVARNISFTCYTYTLKCVECKEAEEEPSRFLSCEHVVLYICKTVLVDEECAHLTRNEYYQYECFVLLTTYECVLHKTIIMFVSMLCSDRGAEASC